MAVVIQGPLAAISPDPLALLLSVVRQFKQNWIDVVNRSAARIGQTSFVVRDNGGAQLANIPLHATQATPEPILALQICSLTLLSAPVLLDEARRVALGQPRGLEPDAPPWDPPGPYAMTQLGFDPVTITAFVGLLVALAPLLVTIVQAALPGLMKFIEGIPAFFSQISGKAEGNTATGSLNVNGSTVSGSATGLFADPLVLGAAVVVIYLVATRS